MKKDKEHKMFFSLYNLINIRFRNPCSNCLVSMTCRRTKCKLKDDFHRSKKIKHNVLFGLPSFTIIIILPFIGGLLIGNGLLYCGLLTIITFFILLIHILIQMEE